MIFHPKEWGRDAEAALRRQRFRVIGGTAAPRPSEPLSERLHRAAVAVGRGAIAAATVAAGAAYVAVAVSLAVAVLEVPERFPAAPAAALLGVALYLVLRLGIEAFWQLHHPIAAALWWRATGIAIIWSGGLFYLAAATIGRDLWRDPGSPLIVFAAVLTIPLAIGTHAILRDFLHAGRPYRTPPPANVADDEDAP